MSLSNAPKAYDQGDQAQMRGQIERLDSQNHKKTKDIEVGANKRVIFTDTATGNRYALVVTSGALVLNGPL